MNDAERRQALADFLRTRRGRLTPGDVGLRRSARRRTPGLRREEIAHLANIGVSWYTALEQGREVHPSEDVLESLSQALRLTAAERQHLFLLARGHVPVGPTPAREEVSSALMSVIRCLDPHPAYVIGRRWDILAWNRSAAILLDLASTFPPHTHNLIWRFFTARQRYTAHHEEVVRGVLAEFRADCARYPGDPWFTLLIDDLSKASSQFRQWWPEHDVRGVQSRHKEIDHPTLGRLEFDHVTLQVAEHQEQKLILYGASPETLGKLANAPLPVPLETRA